MPPPRHVPPTPDELLAPVERDEFTESVLDAAMAEFREFGLRRASIDSVAERLGVGRTTVYRRFGGKEALIQAVMLRETKRYLAGVRNDTGEVRCTFASWRAFARASRETANANCCKRSCNANRSS